MGKFSAALSSMCYTFPGGAEKMAGPIPYRFVRRVYSDGRLIDFNQAVWLMDKALFRKAVASVPFISHERQREDFLAKAGYRILYEMDPEIEAEKYAEAIWQEYQRLHHRRYNESFAPRLPALPASEDELSYFSFRDAGRRARRASSGESP